MGTSGDMGTTHFTREAMATQVCLLGEQSLGLRTSRLDKLWPREQLGQRDSGWR